MGGLAVKRYLTANSVYEVDEADRLIRRVSGLRKPTARVGQDGVWQSYEAVVATDDGLVIKWGDNPDGSARVTWTSPIVAVEEAGTLPPGPTAG